MTDRRSFLTAAAAAPLAQQGGRPVRDKPLRAGHWGCHYLGDEERGETGEVLGSGDLFRYYGQGSQTPKKVAALEAAFAARTGTRFALAVATGTGALDTALAALEVGPGDEVILPAFTFVSCYNTVVLAGALPVFAEIDESFNLDPADVARKITPQTRLILAVHMRGSPCDMDSILEIARARRIRVLEDAAQSLGATYKGRPLGSLGQVGMFSLQVSKSITAGEGGLLSMSDPELYERAVRYHDVGQVRPPVEKVLGKPVLEAFPGTNLRMNELTGGVALAQLRKLDKIVASVRANGRQVYEGIRDLPGIRLRKLADPAGELASGVFLGFAGKETCDRFLAAMRAEGVPASRPSGGSILPTLPHVMRKAAPRHHWPSFSTNRGISMRYGPEVCPRSIDIINRYAGVMMDPAFTPQDNADIVSAIRKVYGAVVKG